LNTYLPTLKQLQYLVALRDHGHFGKAAESCYVTQSTLSAGLRELESLIGIVLPLSVARVWMRFTRRAAHRDKDASGISAAVTS
jgi:LysR family hydrogen peroxide-inducible transcriptional activator